MVVTRHVYECPMRWADMDLLGHVNNVVYVDYLQEARVDMLRTHGPDVTGELAEGVVVVRHEVHYTAPLSFRFRPVKIECWVTEIRAASFTMAYEVFQDIDGDPEGGRRVYLRATTLLTPYVFSTERPRRLSPDEKQTLGEFLEPEERGSRAVTTPARHEKVGHYPVHVRFSDVDVYGHVNNVKYFEFFQEARILMMATALERRSRRVARTLVRGRPDRRRLQPADPVPAGAVRRMVVDLARRQAVAGDRVRDLRRRHDAVASARGPGLLRPPQRPATPPGGRPLLALSAERLAGSRLG